jgi:hypothetical protein
MDQSNHTHKIIMYIILICLVNVMVAILDRYRNRNRNSYRDHVFYGSGEVPITALIYCVTTERKDVVFRKAQKVLMDNLSNDVEHMSNPGDSINVNIISIDRARHSDEPGLRPRNAIDSVGLSKQYDKVPYGYKGRNIYFHHVAHFYGTPEEYGFKPNSADFLIFAGCETDRQQFLIDETNVAKYKTMLKPEGMLIITAEATKNQQVLDMLASEFTTLRGVGSGNFYQKTTMSTQRRPVKQKESACSVM